MIIILSVILVLSACTQTKNKIEADALYGWGEKTGQHVTSNGIEKYGPRMSESRIMIASMILSSNGLSTELDSYDDLYVVKILLPNGNVRAMVVADGKNVFPENID